MTDELINLLPLLNLIFQKGNFEDAIENLVVEVRRPFGGRDHIYQ